MDYEVFLLARVREEYLATGDNARSVATALGGTGRIITCAALIMISIFASFGFTRLIPTREFGLGLAFAVALDATVIRMVQIVDVAGRQMRVLIDGIAAAGRHDFSWDGRDASGRAVPAGVYFARLKTATLAQSHRFVRLY